MKCDACVFSFGEDNDQTHDDDVTYKWAAPQRATSADETKCDQIECNETSAHLSIFDLSVDVKSAPDTVVNVEATHPSPLVDPAFDNSSPISRWLFIPPASFTVCASITAAPLTVISMRHAFAHSSVWLMVPAWLQAFAYPIAFVWPWHMAFPDYMTHTLIWKTLRVTPIWCILDGLYWLRWPPKPHPVTSGWVGMVVAVTRFKWWYGAVSTAICRLDVDSRQSRSPSHFR